MKRDLREIICVELMKLGRGLGIMSSIYQRHMQEKNASEPITQRRTSYVNGRIGSYEFVLDTLLVDGDIYNQYFVMFKKGDRAIFRHYPDLDFGRLTNSSGTEEFITPETAIRRLLFKAFGLTEDGTGMSNQIVGDYEIK